MKFTRRWGNWVNKNGDTSIIEGKRSYMLSYTALLKMEKDKPYTRRAGYALGICHCGLDMPRVFFTKTIIAQILILRDIKEILLPARDNIGTPRLEYYMRKLIKRYRNSLKKSWDEERNPWWVCYVNPRYLLRKRK